MVLTRAQRGNAARTNGAKFDTSKAAEGMDETASTDSSNTSSPVGSRQGSSTDLKSLDKQQQSKTLKDRSKTPNSFYVTLAVVLTAHYVLNVWSVRTLVNWKESMTHAGEATRDALMYLKELMERVFLGSQDENPADWKEIVTAGVVTTLIGTTLYVLIGAPLRAGFWTGSRSTKHKVHRYMGMAYLIQYFAVWIEFVTNYEHHRADSVLPHFIAINGIIQGYSAFFSFKVLPELDDPGYYSDKAVASRKFVHENIYFSLLCVFGSFFYNEGWRDTLQAHPLGQAIEIVFCFFPYVLIRPFFPTTAFSSAGSGRRSRSTKNETFYKYGTLAVKFFYLWAKYFLGFFIQFLWMMHKTTPDQSKFVKGMFLLNLGTISIAIFLHTLRFKGVLPAKLTFSLYLMQIYATFSAIPLAYEMFLTHKKLCGMMFLGILANMTR
eukprot:CAMPEP_0113477244 /NCGR_PEP_ID=MMETSP0014_2-20120614/20103_1 /TAXON_ID=2857 /ORGANISM="Nitzschia sp." /LENGTH=436 /DNA_ID=CAMNT_0000370323 /DNA_START=99 /DNA_END=1405 /DNA_ORIENTATION=+ /assembly_acc=CAM_ASM_000159